MATFVPAIRKIRKDGFAPIYIHITHNGGNAYVRTHCLVHKEAVTTLYSKRGKAVRQINDIEVRDQCDRLIRAYTRTLNRISNPDTLSAAELARILADADRRISFTEYAEKEIAAKRNKDGHNSARNDVCTLHSLQAFFGKENILFDELTAVNVGRWMQSLSHTKRAKSLYPSRLRTIINNARREYNDYDHGITPIHVNPFATLRLPAENVPEKRSLPPDTIRRLFECEPQSPRQRLALDAAHLIFCLAGINAADLYDMPAACLDGWTLKYHRKKTRGKAQANAYNEITAPEQIRGLFFEYMDTERVFDFHKRYSTPIDFVKAINKGLRAVCEANSLPRITTYTLRHSWATIARNEAGATMDEVAQALTHATARRITERYIKRDFAANDTINARVLQIVFDPDPFP